MSLVAQTRIGSTRCPYCHDGLAGKLAIVTCPACATRHHRSCVEELGRCSLYGCEEPLAGTVALDAPVVGEAARAVRARVQERMRGLRALGKQVHAVEIADAPPRPLAALLRWLLP